MREISTVVDGITLPESPRWHGGRLWFVDVFGRRVMSVDPASGGASVRVECEVPQRPSGLGWDAEGRLLVVSQLDRLLLRLEDGVLVKHCDLGRALAPHGDAANPNDMVIDSAGRAFIGSYVYGATEETPLLRVDPDGAVECVALGLRNPNGMAVSPDGRLIVAEHSGEALVEFRIGDGGSLVDRRTFGEVSGEPDGICLDAEGSVWVGCPGSGDLARVAATGEVVERVPFPGRTPVACALGGPDFATVFVATVGPTFFAELDESSTTGRYEAIRVETPGITVG